MIVIKDTISSLMRGLVDLFCHTYERKIIIPIPQKRMMVVDFKFCFKYKNIINKQGRLKLVI